MKSKKNVCAIYNIHLLLGLEVVACLLTSRPLRRLPLLFAAAVVILLAVFAFISLLSPPITNHQLYHTNRHSVIILFGSLFKTVLLIYYLSFSVEPWPICKFLCMLK